MFNLVESEETEIEPYRNRGRSDTLGPSAVVDQVHKPESMLIVCGKLCVCVTVTWTNALLWRFDLDTYACNYNVYIYVPSTYLT